MQTKYSLVFCALLCAYTSAFSQSALDSTPANCNWNLVNRIYSTVSVMGPIYYGKRNANPAYNDVTYAGETDCQLSTNCSVNDTSNMKMMAYYPPLHNYDLAPLPVLLLCHAGGFSDCTYFDANYMDTLCRLFALRGFVTFNIEYRRGRIKDPNGKYMSVQQMIASYRGSQDMRGAIRSIIKLQRNHVALNLPFQVDTNKIFLGGASAGAVMSLNTAYYHNQQMLDSVFPTATGQAKMKDILGPMNANYYYGDTTISIKGKIKGVLSLWGGIALPLSYEKKQSDFFKSSDSTDNPPMIGFHGLYDPVFPISGVAKQRVYFSPPPDNGGENYNSENFCVSNKIVLDSVASSPDLIIGSGLNMYNILKKLGKLTEFYEDCEMRHGLVNDCDACSFQCDFGTGFQSENPVWGYIAQRTATFFQAVLNNAKPSDFGNATTLFVNCENKRVQCNYSDNDNGCNNTDTCITKTTFASINNIMQSKSSIAAKEKIILYPNPVNDILTISGITISSNSKLFIIDALGRVLSSETINNSVIVKNVSHLRSGIYFIKIQSTQQTKTLSFVKQ